MLFVESGTGTIDRLADSPNVIVVGELERQPVRSLKLPLAIGIIVAFMTPVGYQTNLFVYGPDGYDFVDYVRVGAPLQLLLAGVTTLGIAASWGL